jgi:tetratricopeptide (TPR) repeat protein
MSLSGHVDEIVLVDTGSSDETVAIASRFGCRVQHLPWRDDFSEARNHGLGHATADWILYIDADERLSCAQGRALKNLLPGSKAAAAQIRFYPRLDTTAYAEYRLFRRDPRIRFTGSMHETVLPGIRRVCAEDGRVVEENFDITITHYGYEGDQSAKHARNLPLLEKAIETDPDRVYLRYHLGVILFQIGRRAEAELSLLKGLALADVASSLQSRVEGSLCTEILAEIKLRDGKPHEALRIAEQGLRLYADNLVLDLVRARCFLLIGKERQSAELAMRVLDCDPETLFDPRLAYAKHLFGLPCLDVLGTANFKLKNYERAAEFFDRAAKIPSRSLEFRTKAILARARARAAAPTFPT